MKKIILTIFLLALPLVCFAQDTKIQTYPVSVSPEEFPLLISITSNKELYKLGEDINITLQIKNNLKEKVTLETQPWFDLGSMVTFGFWVRIGLDKGDINFNTSESSFLELKPFEERIFKYNLSKMNWNELHSRLPSPMPLSSLIGSGKYTLTFSLAVIDRPTSNTINVQKTITSPPITIEIEGEVTDLSGVKGYLTGMTNEEIEKYFKECISQNKIFIYTGGPLNGPLLECNKENLQKCIENEEFLIGNKIHIISVGCMGGVEEAYKFNKLMFQYLKDKVVENPRSALQLIIKSDKEVYNISEGMVIECEFKNISKKLIRLGDYYKVGPVSFYFKNEQGQTNRVNYIDVVRRIMPIEIAPGVSLKQGAYRLNLTKAENYEIIGKHSIYMVDGNLTSNTITIEVVEKDLTKEEAIRIAQKAIRELRDIDINKYYLKEIKEFEWKSRDIWRLTFDLKEKLQPKGMKKGGEIFVNVDKKTGETAIRYGE